MVCGGQVFAVKKEEIGDLAVSGDETLTLPRGLEAHHAPLSSSHSKMEIVSLVVQSLVRAMFDLRHQIRLRSRIGTQLIGQHHARGDTLTLEQFAH